MHTFTEPAYTKNLEKNSGILLQPDMPRGILYLVSGLVRLDRNGENAMRKTRMVKFHNGEVYEVHYNREGSHAETIIGTLRRFNGGEWQLWVSERGTGAAIVEMDVMTEIVAWSVFNK